MILRLQFTVLLVLLVAGCWRHPAPPRDEVMLRLFFQKRAAFEAVIAEAMRPDEFMQSKKSKSIIVDVFPGEDARLDALMNDIGFLITDGINILNGQLTSPRMARFPLTLMLWHGTRSKKITTSWPAGQSKDIGTSVSALSPIDETR